MEITNDIKYVGVNDHKVDLFEGQYVAPNGMSYNSYVILDSKIAVMDTVDQNFTHEWLDNLSNRKNPDYLVVQHMEPDHSANIAKFMDTYSKATIASSEKAFNMMQNYFGTAYEDRRIVVAEGDTLELGKHSLTFVAAPMVHRPEVIVTYDSTDKVLFSADGFGKFEALNVEEEWADEARRYYIGIVGKYDAQNSEKANKSDFKALFKIGYGLYVVTCNNGKKDNGVIVNSVTQVTDSPNRVAVCINKQNYSHHKKHNLMKRALKGALYYIIEFVKIYVIRHGETEANKQGILQGSSDFPLNENGIKLAQITGEKMKNIKFDACFSSPQVRAAKTAEIILEKSGNNIPIQYDDRIKEINMGDFEGKCIRPENLEVPLLKIIIFKQNAFLSRRFKGGENARDVCARTQNFLNELITKDYESVLVSTHGCASRAMLNKLFDHPFNFWQGRVPYNCAVSILEANDGKVKILEKDKIYYDPKYIVDRFKFLKE